MNIADYNNAFPHRRGAAPICALGTNGVAMKRAAGDGRFIH